jgi:peptidylprolyl isomerase
MKRLSVVVLVIVPLVSFAQPLPERAYRAILTAQDFRDVSALVPFLEDADAQVRARAALACGSVQPDGPIADTSIIPILINLLTDKNQHVRAAAGFALGQLHPVLDSTQREKVSAVLSRRLGLESHQSVLVRVLEALGKMGTAGSLSVVVATGESSPSAVVKGEAALSVGRYAYRGIMSKTATAFAVRCLGLQQATETWKAAAALMRISDAALLLPHEGELVRASSDRSADVRMFIATALGRLASSHKAVNALLSMTRSDKDWRVRVNAVRALARADTAFFPRMMTTLLRTVRDSNEHVALSALATLSELPLRTSSFAAECRKVLIEQMREASTSRRLKRQAALALGRIFGEEAYLILNEQHRLGNLPDESFAAALAYTPTSDAVHDLLSFAKSDAPFVRQTALEALRTVAGRLPTRLGVLAEVRQAFVDAIQSDDLAILSTAAEALADSALRGDDSAVLLVNALRRLKSPNDAEAMVTIMQRLAVMRAAAAIAPLESYLYDTNPAVVTAARAALLAITGKKYEAIARPAFLPSHTNFDWALLDSIRKNPYVTVQTSKGTFTLRLLPDEAPFTCINFVTLVNRRFFDGLTFHRVVPNFVIQGGDPRGDGWGGPGYSIRSEFGLEHYTRGTVGMASAGKDTEGCQWFVTHCNTPHLDGRYTIFGKVVSGMEVMDEIQVGDRMEVVRW